MANDNAKYTPTQWEKITAVAVAFFIVGLISFLVIRDRPFSDLNFVIFVRILLSLSCSILGAVVPGFLQVDMRKKGLVIRAGGALALFIVTFFFTPSVISSVYKPKVNSPSFVEENHKDNHRNSQSKSKSLLVKIPDISSSSVNIENKQNESIHEDSSEYNKKIIEDFADRMCGPSDKVCGTENIIELNEKAESELKSIIGKITKSSAGAEENDEETRLYYALQEDIVIILKKYADCRLKYADCKNKIFELLKDRITSPDQDSSKPHADNAGENKKSSPGNLVVNGDFSAHWSEGWKKNVSDRTKGSLHVETVPSSNDPSDKLLHLHLEGQGAGWVEQKAYLPDGKGIKNMFVEFEMKTATETNGFNLGEPIEAFFGIQFTDKDGNNLGQINFSAGKKSDFEDTGMYGVPSSLKSNNSRCMIKTNPQYHSMKENLYNKYIDCFSPNGIDKIKSIDMVAYLQASRSNQNADIYLDNIKIYYKD